MSEVILNALFSTWLLGVVNFTMVPFGRQTWSKGEAVEERKTAFVDRGFDFNPFIIISKFYRDNVKTLVQM